MGQLFSLSRCSAAGALGGLWVPRSPQKQPAQDTQLYPSATQDYTSQHAFTGAHARCVPAGRYGRRNPFRSRFRGAEVAHAVR